MKKTRILGLALAGLLSLNGMAALADTNRTFSDYELFANNQNNYTVYRAKETNNDYSYVNCTDLWGTDKVTFWIDAGKRISNTVTIPETSSFYTMKYTVNKSTNDKVRLGMENYYDDDESAYASGTVDYE